MGPPRVKARWTRRALRQFTEAQDYIALDNPAAAKAVAHRVLDAIDTLLSQPQLGRPGRVEGTREWPVNRTPYLLAYRVESDTLQILAVIHGKQLWPASLS